MTKDGNWCQCSAAIKDIVCTKIGPACMRLIQQQPLLLHPIENFPAPRPPRILHVLMASEKKRRNCYLKLCIMRSKMSRSEMNIDIFFFFSC